LVDGQGEPQIEKLVRRVGDPIEVKWKGWKEDDNMSEDIDKLRQDLLEMLAEIES